MGLKVTYWKSIEQLNRFKHLQLNGVSQVVLLQLDLHFHGQIWHFTV